MGWASLRADEKRQHPRTLSGAHAVCYRCPIGPYVAGLRFMGCAIVKVSITRKIYRIPPLRLCSSAPAGRPLPSRAGDWNPIHLPEEKVLPIFQCIRFVQRLCIVRFKVKVSSTSKRSTRGCVHSLPAHASIERRAHVAQSEWWEVEYESKHIPNFNWSFLLNCTVNLKLDWNIVFVRINVTKWGPICYLYFFVLLFQHLNIIVQHF